MNKDYWRIRRQQRNFSKVQMLSIRSTDLTRDAMQGQTALNVNLLHTDMISYLISDLRATVEEIVSSQDSVTVLFM